MYKTLLEGYPTLGISEKIAVPDIAGLLAIPTFYRGDIDDVYRHGGEELRKLIDATPLTHTKKYYVVRVQMQFIKPGYCPVNTTEWHVDGQDIPTMQSGDITHLLVGNTSNLLTEFLAEPVEIEESFDVSMLGHLELMKYFEANQYKWGFQPKKIEPDRFVTMGCRHVHRVGVVDKPEFRFFFEIRESDYHTPRPYEEARVREQFVHKGNRGAKEVCLEQSKRWGVIIRDRY